MNTNKSTYIEHIKTALEYYGIKHERSQTKYKEGMKLPTGKMKKIYISGD